jgi:Ca2+-binding RTX toxin-like protein
VVGDAGTDEVDYSTATGPVDVDLGAQQATRFGDIDTLSSVENATGSGQSDTLAGGVGNNLLDGAAGTGDLLDQTADANLTLADTLLTGQGNDTLAGIEDASLTGGGLGNDLDAAGWTLGPVSLSGLGGNDSLNGTGDPSGDSISGGADDDNLVGGGGDDTLDGGTETGSGDTADYGASGGVDLDLAAGTADFGPSNQDLTEIENAIGSPSADTLAGDGTANDLDGAGGSDGLSGAGGADTATGAGGADSLTGAAGDDSLDAGSENDTLQGGADDDNLVGGSGVNTADYSDNLAGIGIDANLVTNQVANASTDTLSGIQALIGTSFDDTMVGDGAANTLAGAAGADSISGGGGADLIQGLAGGDTLTGDAGGDDIEGGTEDDLLNSQDGGTADGADCGEGPVEPDADVANADVDDAVTNCETENNPPAGQPGGPPANPPPGGGGGDTTPPSLGLTGKKKQKSKSKLKVEASCDEACAVEAGGTIKVPKVKKAGKSSIAEIAKKKTYDLSGTSADLAAGQPGALTLKIAGKAKKALKKAISTKKSKATIEATATDAAGNESAAELIVKVFKKKK